MVVSRDVGPGNKPLGRVANTTSSGKSSGRVVIALNYCAISLAPSNSLLFQMVHQ